MANNVLDKNIEGIYLNGQKLETPEDFNGIKFNGTIIWTPLPVYTVNFYHLNSWQDTKKVKEGRKVTFPTEFTGYAGRNITWRNAVEGGNVVDQNQAIMADTNFYGFVDCYVKFFNQGQEIQVSTVEEQQVIKNNQAPLPSRDGYTFGGWYTGENGAGFELKLGQTVITSDISYYALWTIIQPEEPEVPEEVPTIPNITLEDVGSFENAGANNDLYIIEDTNGNPVRWELNPGENGYITTSDNKNLFSGYTWAHLFRINRWRDENLHSKISITPYEPFLAYDPSPYFTPSSIRPGYLRTPVSGSPEYWHIDDAGLIYYNYSNDPTNTPKYYLSQSGAGGFRIYSEDDKGNVSFDGLKVYSATNI